MKILFATPAAGGMVHWTYHMSALCELFIAKERLANLERYDICMWMAGGYSGLGKDRGVAASYALREGFDKIFFVDSDQSWKWRDARKILDSDKPVIAGMVPLKSHPIQLNFTTQPQDSHYFDAEDGTITPKGIDRWRINNPGKDELQVSAVGTAFMSIDVWVLKKMVEAKHAEPFVFKQMVNGKPEFIKCWDFFPSGPIENNYYGEDYGFCIQAQRSGVPVYVDTSVEIPHHGQYMYTIEEGRDKSAQMELPLQDACHKSAENKLL